jgi:hypothetical protein
MDRAGMAHVERGSGEVGLLRRRANSAPSYHNVTTPSRVIACSDSVTLLAAGQPYDANCPERDGKRVRWGRQGPRRRQTVRWTGRGALAARTDPIADSLGFVLSRRRAGRARSARAAAGPAGHPDIPSATTSR